ncbi:isochorismate synthase MenF [Schumannella sp. 10F1B-5-1]|uniref:isochorismate synthase n=1 Tax=Schumannella sp. 10F1B-5-1 TaxID=2590780 RepID=UPI00113124B0|nr:isochorismate synthase [Schumannella sp. 10F1B-5-1]TPW71542.1 isochorismate synthase [Schumannella sp. 10F1B-5-1]
MTDPADSVPALRVVTTPIAQLPSLLPLIDGVRPLVFLRRGDGVAGLGETLRLTFRGPDRIRDAAAVWKRIAAAATIDDPIGISGTGLIAFGAFAFADDSARESVLIVPRVIVGRRDGQSWVTRIDDADDALESTPLGPEYRLLLKPGAQGPDAYREAVAAAVQRIQSDAGLGKVVIARDKVGHLPEGADLRRVLTELALGYPDTWTFAVDGLLGSSPETLVRVAHGTVTARVLAGSAGRGKDAESDHAEALALATSQKDLDEHRFAVQSVLDALAPHSPSLVASELPFTLKLPNLWHLASDVEGTLADGSTALDLVCELHPTAAVAGTPRAAALATIAELEPFDRARWGGPVGWVDAAGNGKWAVALRSAEIDADGTITAYAGAGIVAESDPERELAETTLKFRPIVEAFG